MSQSIGPESEMRRQLGNERCATLTEHQATAELWGFNWRAHPFVSIGTLTRRGRVARRSGWLWLAVGCAISGGLSALAMDLGGPIPTFTAGVVVAVSISLIVKTAMRSLLDAYPENPDAIKSLKTLLAAAVTAILAGAAIPLALRFVAIEVPDWCLLISVGLVEIGCLTAGAALELEGHMLLWSDRLMRKIHILDERVLRFDKQIAFRAALSQGESSTDHADKPGSVLTSLSQLSKEEEAHDTNTSDPNAHGVEHTARYSRSNGHDHPCA